MSTFVQAAKCISAALISAFGLAMKRCYLSNAELSPAAAVLAPAVREAASSMKSVVSLRVALRGEVRRKPLVEAGRACMMQTRLHSVMTLTW
ncbi:MAG: hypothetical protein U5K75_06940 [Ahrensia sp.]|nr:hypothetical protein [Ahrensia sp.]